MEHESKLKKIKSASRILRLSTIEIRNQVLLDAAQMLLEKQKEILLANKKDLDSLPNNTAPAFKDRLTLTSERIEHMATSLKQVARLADPLAAESAIKTLQNGLQIKKVKSPLGVVFMIFESRPNVAVEAFSMGFKSGNCMILRGGKESQKTVSTLYKILNLAIKKNRLPADIIWGITDSDRRIVNALLKQSHYIDVVVPRGGDSLINYVVNNSLIPIIKNDRGLCHVYAHSDADLGMALKILVNAKTQRPGVCNSMETMLIHQNIAGQLLPEVYKSMSPHQVKWFVDQKSFKILKGLNNINHAVKKSWNTEYLDQIVNCKIVASIDEAISHIEQFGSHHSESIITRTESLARKFQKEVDAAAVYWNTTTRFTDGFEFGLGGELGISTQKLHVRGPVGLDALTSERWVIDGHGQIRI